MGRSGGDAMIIGEGRHCVYGETNGRAEAEKETQGETGKKEKSVVEKANLEDGKNRLTRTEMEEEEEERS
ncbi:hypothetical protein E2C01_056615 [Portunus trituberculatus]|uniref:Uncharacterized protein n=1 Tax=Portunus trituberculatus TaxID=210409 RepID=A0A5B7GRA3_PORTR|nr:hypothetical protein [Portunus trituberculatus]